MKESSLNKFHFGNKDEPSLFHTNVESIAKRVLNRNPKCKLISHEGEEWLIEIPQSEVRDPSMWIKKVGEVVDEEGDIPTD